MRKKKVTNRNVEDDIRAKVLYNRVDVLKQPSFIERLWDTNPDMLKYPEPEIQRILSQVNLKIGNIIATTREGVAFPLHMGIAFSGTYGKKEDTVDIATTKKIKKEVTYNNHHSDGYGARIYYITNITRARFGLGKYWGLVPADSMSKSLCRSYKKNWKIYAHVPSISRAAKLFKKMKNKEYAQEKSQETIRSYNEFDMD